MCSQVVFSRVAMPWVCTAGKPLPSSMRSGGLLLAAWPLCVWYAWRCYSLPACCRSSTEPGRCCVCSCSCFPHLKSQAHGTGPRRSQGLGGRLRRSRSSTFSRGRVVRDEKEWTGSQLDTEELRKKVLRRVCRSTGCCSVAYCYYYYLTKERNSPPFPASHRGSAVSGGSCYLIRRRLYCEGAEAKGVQPPSGSGLLSRASFSAE